MIYHMSYVICHISYDTLSVDRIHIRETTFAGRVCDEHGGYDRRMRWVLGAQSGEVVTTSASQLDEYTTDGTASARQGRVLTVRVPITRLVRAAPWVVGPQADSQIAGVYIGTEIWGAGRTLMKISDYQLA